MKTIVYDIETVKRTCCGCPTIYEFKDIEGNDYYFRLRHGYWYLEDETNDTIICEGKTHKFDGRCSWEDMLELVGVENIKSVKQGIKSILYINESVVCTCGGCPTVFEFKDNEGNDYYFRLRHGYWYLEDETNDVVMCEGKTHKFDGCCSWEEALELINEKYNIKENK